MNGKDVIRKMKELLFVYNADSTAIAQFTDLFIKLFTPKKYSCNLCLVTYGMLRMKRAWKVFIDFDGWVSALAVESVMYSSGTLGGQAQLVELFLDHT